MADARSGAKVDGQKPQESVLAVEQLDSDLMVGIVTAVDAYLFWHESEKTNGAEKVAARARLTALFEREPGLQEAGVVVRVRGKNLRWGKSGGTREKLDMDGFKRSLLEEGVDPEVIARCYAANWQAGGEGATWGVNIA